MEAQTVEKYHPPVKICKHHAHKTKQQLPELRVKCDWRDDAYICDNVDLLILFSLEASSVVLVELSFLIFMMNMPQIICPLEIIPHCTDITEQYF